MAKADAYTQDAMPPHVWAALVEARKRAVRGDPREWYRLLRRYCGYTAGSGIGLVMEMRINDYINNDAAR